MKKTKLLTSIAALALVLGLGACEVNVDVGGDVTIGGDGSETTTDTTTEEDDGDTSSPDTEPGEGGAGGEVSTADYATITSYLEPLAGKTSLADALEAVQLSVTLLESEKVDNTLYVAKASDGTTNGIAYYKDDEENYIVQFLNNGTTYIETVDEGETEYSKLEYTATYASLLGDYDHAVSAAAEILGKIEAVTLTEDDYELEEGGIGYELTYYADDGSQYIYEVNYQGALRYIYVDALYQGAADATYVVHVISESDVTNALLENLDLTKWGAGEVVSVDELYHTLADGSLQPHQAGEDGACTVCDATGLHVDGWSYTLGSDSTYYVSGYTSAVGVSAAFIPATHEGVAVTALGASGAGMSAGALYNEATLHFIGLPEGLTTINSYVLRATAIESIYIPATISKIDTGAFYGCASLATIEFAPSGVLTELPTDVFNGAGLTSVTLPETITTLGDDTFQNCASLVSATLPESITSIGTRTFQGCSALEEVTLPQAITELPNYTFYNCSLLTEDGITLSSNLTKIGNYGFDGTAITTIDFLPDTLTTLGTYVFTACKELTEVIMPANITTIDQRDFQDCSNITYFDLGSNFTSIPSYFWSGCNGLETVVIGSAVTTINSSAFNNNSAIATVYYGGTEDQWSALSNKPTSSYTIYYSGEWTYGEDGLATPIAA